MCSATIVDMESYKAALVKSQEIVDVIYELIEYEEEDSYNSLLLKASVLAEMDFLTSHHHLQWPEFRPNEVLSLLEFTAIQMSSGISGYINCSLIIVLLIVLQNTWMPHLNELFHGTMFMLRHPSVKDLFSKEPFHYLPQLQNVIAGIVKLLEAVS
uniref:NR LBD domain-containing protein n=1 Tax=Heterorhabditis bacteriophora TaxID=37862 RepID=A0A1I7W8C8_HETBA